MQTCADIPGANYKFRVSAGPVLLHGTCIFTTNKEPGLGLAAWLGGSASTHDIDVSIFLSLLLWNRF